MSVRFILNGTLVRVDAIDPHVTLLAWLRERGQTGTKEGCAEGECGACAVALLRRDAWGGSQLAAVNSCLLPLVALDGQSVTSVEGVAAASGELHPVQQALIDKAGSQCGYCTPGFVVSLFCEYYRRGRDAYDPEAISGNLCRCTGYRPIVDAARSLPLPAADDPQLRALESPPSPLPTLVHESTSASFLRPTSLPELFAQLARYPNATVIGGGTDLMVYANQRYTRYPTLIALEALAELQHFEVNEREISIGAGIPLTHVAERIEKACPEAAPVLAQLWPLFSSRLIRNRATLGGNLGTGSPIGDSPPVLLALDAELRLVSAQGERRLPLQAFFVGYRKTALVPGEIIASVHLPLPLPKIQRFYKASKRVLDDISTVAAAFALDLSHAGQVERLRIAYGGIAATPVRAHAVEQLALGQVWNAALRARVREALKDLGTPLSDFRGSAAYRRALVGTLFDKFYSEATE